MTKYLEPSFSTMAPPGEDYRQNWDRIFSKKPTVEVVAIEGDSGTTQTLADPEKATLSGAHLLAAAKALADAVEDELRLTHFLDPRIRPIAAALKAWRAVVPRGP